VTTATALDRSPNGRLWIGTNRGVFSYHPERGIVRQFNEETGLPSLTIQPRALVTDATGSLWVGTARGLAHLDVSSLPSTPTPRPLFTSLNSNDQNVGDAASASPYVPARTALKIGFAAPTFVKSKVLYQYRFAGREEAWTYVEGGPPLVLSGLDGGTYALEIRAQQPGLSWSPVGRLRFTVGAPWYRQWWAYGVAGVFGVGLLVLLGMFLRNWRARQRAEQALYRSRAQYELVVENVDEAIFQTDADGQWTFLNPAWTDITGYAVEDSIGRSCFDFVLPDDRETLESTFHDLLDDGTEHAQCQVRLREASGPAHWVEFRAQRLNGHGASPGITGIIVDIQDQKEYEQRLIEAKEEAEEMNRLKTVFLANMSHELRTPLTSILGFARTLSQELPDSYEDLVAPIETSGRRLKRTFDSVLSLAELEHDAVELNLHPVDVPKETKETASLFRSETAQTDLTLEIDVPEHAIHAPLDRDAYERVLSNLVSNAIKFTPEGRVLVRVREQDDEVMIDVSDTGIGIDESFLPDIFDEFKQESDGRTRGYQGTGLGLTIVKRLVTRMNGTICVDSEKGQGSTFRIRFPKATVAQEEG
jgi:PAS domain S-box-containing protein